MSGYMHISETAHWDPAIGEDITSLITIAQRGCEHFICFSVDVPKNQPNLFAYFSGKLKGYKLVKRAFGITELVKVFNYMKPKVLQGFLTRVK